MQPTGGTACEYFASMRVEPWKRRSAVGSTLGTFVLFDFIAGKVQIASRTFPSIGVVLLEPFSILIDWRMSTNFKIEIREKVAEEKSRCFSYFSKLGPLPHFVCGEICCLLTKAFACLIEPADSWFVNLRLTLTVLCDRSEHMIRWDSQMLKSLRIYCELASRAEDSESKRLISFTVFCLTRGQCASRVDEFDIEKDVFLQRLSFMHGV